MIRRIQAFVVELTKQEIMISIPRGGEIKHFDWLEAPQKLYIWVEREEDQPAVFRRFQLFGTGIKIPGDPHDLVYVGTTTVRPAVGGDCVLHLYERIRR